MCNGPYQTQRKGDISSSCQAGVKNWQISTFAIVFRNICARAPPPCYFESTTPLVPDDSFFNFAKKILLYKK